MKKNLNKSGILNFPLFLFCNANNEMYIIHLCNIVRVSEQ